MYILLGFPLCSGKDVFRVLLILKNLIGQITRTELGVETLRSMELGLESKGVFALKNVLFYLNSGFSQILVKILDIWTHGREG